ncbi:hypothetical protein BKA62DRAFT_765131 [Auriculariales sp. MPI-PUGE-AT-0066]|nr:hypothetical protein BKA62DRAFT_765131 [Auriculariales sp. MPI-PUGE-AT-0066]
MVVRPKIHPAPLWSRLSGFHPSFSTRWGPTAAIWGAGAGVYVLYILSVTPLVKREFLTKLPGIGSYYEDHRPASDRPM